MPGFIDKVHAVGVRAGAVARERLGVWYRATSRRHAFRRIAIPRGIGLDAATRDAALTFLDGMVGGYRDLGWHEAYVRANRLPSPYYLPEDIFHALVMPRLNPQERAQILKDKQHYDLLPGWPRRPATLGRIINGRLLDASFAPATLGQVMAAASAGDEVVVKPSRASSGGKRVRFCRPGELATTISGYQDAVIQRAVVQHPALASLNPSSVNTIRAITYRRLDGRTIFISGAIRIGRSGKRVDNRVAGGIACAIDGDGRLGEAAYDVKFRRYERHPDSNAPFGGQTVPGYAKVRAAVLAAHEHTPWLDLASWDVTVEEDGEPTVIEVNVGTSLNLPQITNGAVFAPVIDDIKQRIGAWRYLPIVGFVRTGRPPGVGAGAE